MSTIADGKVVAFHYTLTNDTGDKLDSSHDRGEPLAYLHGASNIVPGLEKQLGGLEVGSKLEAVVPPEEGYGERGGPPPQAVPRTAFPEEMPIEKGMPVQAQSPDGQVMMLFIDRVEDDTVYVDHNHPLAGVTLHFDVEVTDIRDASAEEKSHGHPHGPGGHAH